MECGSRETAKLSELAGGAEYGHCASHSCWSWGRRLHLICTLHGLPVGWPLTGAKADERHVVTTMLPGPRPSHRPITLIGDRTTTARPSRLGLPRPGCGCCDPPAKANTPRQRSFPQTTTPGHRVDQPHPEKVNSTSHSRCFLAVAPQTELPSLRARWDVGYLCTFAGTPLALSQDTISQ